jgi:hypothetical protein
VQEQEHKRRLQKEETKLADPSSASGDSLLGSLDGAPDYLADPSCLASFSMIAAFNLIIACVHLQPLRRGLGILNLTHHSGAHWHRIASSKNNRAHLHGLGVDQNHAQNLRAASRTLAFLNR